jgi:hypothetical protein
VKGRSCLLNGTNLRFDGLAGANLGDDQEAGSDGTDEGGIAVAFEYRSLPVRWILLTASVHLGLSICLFPLDDETAYSRDTKPNRSHAVTFIILTSHSRDHPKCAWLQVLYFYLELFYTSHPITARRHRSRNHTMSAVNHARVSYEGSIRKEEGQKEQQRKAKAKAR